jgi:hypothetical protein
VRARPSPGSKARTTAAMDSTPYTPAIVITIPVEQPPQVAVVAFSEQDERRVLAWLEAAYDVGGVVRLALAVADRRETRAREAA